MKLKALVYLIASAAILISSGCGTTPEKTARRHMDRGAAAEAKSNFRLARVEYEVASQNTPSDPEPVYHVGLTELRLHDGRAAVEAFEKTLRLRSDHPGALYEYGRMKAEARQPEILRDAAGMFEKILLNHPADAQALFALAMVETKLNSDDVALRHYQAALDVPQAPVEGASLAIAAALRASELPLAKRFVSLAMATLPRSAEIAEAAAEVAMIAGDLKTAETETSRALSLNPRLPAALQLRIRLADNAGRAGDAESAASMLAALPDPATRDAYADILMRHGRTDDALREYKAVMAKDPSGQLTQERYIDALFRAHRRDQARAELDSALRHDAKRADLLLMRARLALDENRTEDAGRDIHAIRQLNFRNESVALAEAIYRYQRGEAVLEGNLLSEALTRNPRMLEARLRLSRLFNESGKPEMGLRIIDDATEAERATPLLALYRNTALMATGAWADARTAVIAQLAAHGGKDASQELRVQDASIKVHFSDFSGAEKEIADVLKTSPGNSAALVVMSSIYAGRRQPREYISWLTAYADANPNVPGLQIQTARVLRSVGDLTSARRDLARVTSGSMADQANIELAAVDCMEGRFGEARSILQNSIQKHDTAIARVLLADIYSRSHDWPHSEEQLRAALALSPSDPVILLNLAAAISKNPKRTDEALPFAEKALASSQGNPVVESSSGWIYYMTGQYQQAVTHLEASLRASDTATTRYRLAAACLKAGDRTCAKTQYEAALRRNPSDPVRSEIDPLVQRFVR